MNTVRHASLCKNVYVNCKPFSNMGEPIIKLENPEEESLKKYLNRKFIKNSGSEISEDEG